MNFYEKNMEFLRKKDSELVEKLEDYLKEENAKAEKERENVFVEEGQFGYPVITYEKNGQRYQLSSPYDGEGTYEEKWYSQFLEWDCDGILTSFGMSRLSHIAKFREENSEYLHLIYEPSIAVFLAILEWADITFLSKQDVLTIGGINDNVFRACIYSVTSTDTIYNMKHLCIPNYERIFAKEYKEYVKHVKHISENRIMDENVWIRFSKEITRNLRENIKDILRGSNLCEVMRSFPDGKPGILVSAGPSLNNNIDELQNAAGKALIVATDTALKPLLNHGIRPDAFVTVDPSKPLVLFDKEEVWDIPMILMEGGNAQVTERHRGKKFFTLNWEGLGRNLYDRFGKELPLLETGGSVANNAFSFIRDCGCNPIILVGQDLAYTNMKSHADGTFQDKMEDVDTRKRTYIEIEDIYGNTTLTTYDFKHYLEWFEEHIGLLKEKDVKVIDATEGGAKIEGAEIRTLKDVVAEYCTDEFEIGKYFEEAPDAFAKDERREMEEYLLDTPNILDKIKKKAKRGKQDYEDMIFHIKRDEWGRELKSGLKKVGKLATFLDEDETMRLVIPYLAEYDLLYKRKVREMDINTTEGLLQMLESGKEYMEKIIETVDLLRDDFVAMTEKVKELQRNEE